MVVLVTMLSAVVHRSRRCAYPVVVMTWLMMSAVTELMDVVVVTQWIVIVVIAIAVHLPLWWQLHFQE